MARRSTTPLARAEFRLPPNAIVTQSVARVFTELHLSAALRDSAGWYPIHKVSDMVEVEIAHGVEERRYAYNERCLNKVRREGAILLGEHAGFHDVFAPVRDAHGAWGVLVVGPFATGRPTSDEILARWRHLSGGHARASDPDFRQYVATTLAVTTFAGVSLEIFLRIVACVAEILVGTGKLDHLGGEVETLLEKLVETRLPERMWEGARLLVDEYPVGGWLNHWRSRENAFMELGTTNVPKHVVVGLLPHHERETGPVDDLLRRDAFQRACAQFAHERGGVLSGRIADFGVVLLVDHASSGARLKAKLGETGERIRTLARRFGFGIHLGVSNPEGPVSLPARYQSALSAAESALTRGLSIVYADRHPRRLHTPLRELRAQLAHALEGSPNLLSARFDRYLDGVIVGSGYRLELIQGHLEAGFDLLTHQLRGANVLDEKSLVDAEDRIRIAAAGANTVRELSAAFRGVVADLELALQKPKDARQDRSIRRAVAYIRDHFAEPLRLSRVARVAGFAPGYFSKLFSQNEKLTFHEYVRNLRVEQAKQMLTATRLNAERVGKLSGLGSRSRFHAVFSQSVGMTPMEYRRRNPPASIYLPVPKARRQIQDRG